MTARTTADLDVTVVVATLNADAYLADALTSVGDEVQRCQQAGYSAEVLIADGGSTDATLDIAGGFPFVTILPGTDTGLYNGFNRGVKAARGMAITFVNSDDQLLPGALTAALAVLKSDETPGWTSIDITQGRSVESAKAMRRDCPLNLEGALFGIPAINGLVIRTSTFETVGLFDEHVGLSADRLLVVGLARSGLTGHHLAQPGYFYRLHDGSLTGSFDAHARDRIFKAELAMANHLKSAADQWPAGDQALVGAHRAAWTARDYMRKKRWLALGTLAFSGSLLRGVASWRRWRGRLSGW
ncbi:MAG: glycosyltransferase [Ahrensia sp.]